MAITANTGVLTLDYWKYADKIEVGDYVFDKDGQITKVKLVQRYFAEDCYEVVFNDLLSVKGDKHLAFMLEDDQYRKKLRAYKMVQKFFRRPLKVYKISELLEKPLRAKRGGFEFSVPTTKPLELPHQYHAIPAFVFGFWFMNRKKHKSFVAYHDEVFEKFKDAGYKTQTFAFGSSPHKYFFEVPNVEKQMVPNIPSKIPTNYIMGSVEERTELLSGLVMGKANSFNVDSQTFRLTHKNLPILQSIQCVVESLGNGSKLTYDNHYKYYTLSFKCRQHIMPGQKHKPIKVHYNRRFIREINPTQPQMCVHIETENNNAVLVGEGFISVC